MEHRNDPGLFHQHIGDIFEGFCIERVADRLRFGDRRAHRFGAVLKLATDAFAVDGGGVAVPGKTLDADLGYIAAETTITLEQNRLDPRACRCERCRQPPGARADHQHIGFADNVNPARGLINGAGHLWAVSQSGAV